MILYKERNIIYKIKRYLYNYLMKLEKVDNMVEEKALLFNIQRFSTNDGKGIRTIIFFKGCQLRCPWCSNPESQFLGEEQMKSNVYTNIKKNVGKLYSVDEIVKEVLKDEIFYNTSKGGVTLSGGEVLMQAKIATKLLRELKENQIHTTIETCGEGNSDLFLKLIKYVDEVLFDLKIIDKLKAKKILNANIENILYNFKISSQNSNTIVRFPYIPNYTDDINNIKQIINISKEENIEEIHILPYHNYGSVKYELLDRKYLLKNLKTPSENEINRIKRLFESYNFKVLIGG